MQCHIKLTAANIMELNELPVDGGETPAGSCLLTRKNALDGINLCNFTGLQSKILFESCEEVTRNLALKYSSTACFCWQLQYGIFPHLFPRVQAPDLSRERGAKSKGKSSGCSGFHLISTQLDTLCNKAGDKISRQTPPAVLQHL